MLLWPQGPLPSIFGSCMTAQLRLARRCAARSAWSRCTRTSWRPIGQRYSALHALAIAALRAIHGHAAMFLAGARRSSWTAAALTLLFGSTPFFFRFISCFRATRYVLTCKRTRYKQVRVSVCPCSPTFSLLTISVTSVVVAPHSLWQSALVPRVGPTAAVILAVPPIGRYVRTSLSHEEFLDTCNIMITNYVLCGNCNLRVL